MLTLSGIEGDENRPVPYIFPSTETWKTPFDVGCFESDKTKGTGLRQNRILGTGCPRFIY